MKTLSKVILSATLLFIYSHMLGYELRVINISGETITGHIWYKLKLKGLPKLRDREKEFTLEDQNYQHLEWTELRTKDDEGSYFETVSGERIEGDFPEKLSKDNADKQNLDKFNYIISKDPATGVITGKIDNTYADPDEIIANAAETNEQTEKTEEPETPQQTPPAQQQPSIFL